MNKIATIAGILLICLPTIAFAQATGAAPGVTTAPIGHLQPRPAATPDKGSTGLSGKDDPAEVDKELQPSTDKAIHSLCSYCLKPEGHKKQR